MSGTDFVYINVAGNPIRIKRWGDDLWAFYWHPDKKWVSQQKVGEVEVLELMKHALCPADAACYGVKGSNP